MVHIDEITHPRSRVPRFLLGAALALGFALVGAARAADRPLGKDACAADAPCVVIEYEEPVASEAIQLSDALRLRLATYGVHVVADEAAERAARPGGEVASLGTTARPNLYWVVHLRRLSRDLLLVAVDNLVSTGAEDVVREIARGESESSTVWTMALMIEEIVTPYFTKGPDAPALGAGLAIIEPPAVGGAPARDDDTGPQYPRFRALGLGLLILGVVSADSLATGPVLHAEGAFAPRFLASASVGWAGIAHFTSSTIDGKIHFIPVDLGLGYAMYVSRTVELSVWTGLAVGFAAYATRSDAEPHRDRVDVLFEPGALASLRLAFALFGPLRCYFKGGIVIPFVHDDLESGGTRAYESSWVLPSVEVGVHFRFRNF